MVKVKKGVLVSGVVLMLSVVLLTWHFLCTSHHEEEMVAVEVLKIIGSGGTIELDFTKVVGPLYEEVQLGKGTQYVSRKRVIGSKQKPAGAYVGKPAKITLKYWRMLQTNSGRVVEPLFGMTLTANKRITFWWEEPGVLVMDIQGRWP